MFLPGQFRDFAAAHRQLFSNLQEDGQILRYGRWNILQFLPQLTLVNNR